ncbi:TBC1 domain family member 25 isoform X2 [Pteropus medius]|uniref:TBC1 domain family member 25 isoform X2 n=1 Tax=Pteropus vampyrus TaxID=132908 RepID=UPI00196B333A|nr:TBC1 domain family member 25 isoform X2 [Pteropus giganteus]
MATASVSLDLASFGAPPPGGGVQAATAEEEEREVVRVRVKKCESFLPPEFRSFAVDPQITSLDVLQHILIRAFDLNGKKAAFFPLLSLNYPVTLPRGDQHFTSFQCALQIQAGRRTLASATWVGIGWGRKLTSHSCLTGISPQPLPLPPNLTCSCV